jgi:hypothetical protein
MTVGELNVEIGAKLDKLERALGKMEGEIRGAGKSAERSTQASFTKVGGFIAAAFSVDAIMNFSRQVISVRGEFEKFEAVLTNTLGSNSAAQLALSDIQDFAASTPFSVQELTGSFVKLANQGFKPTIAQMRLLGDLAASTGKDFDQLAEAIIDAQVGEFERLKEFGIRAQKEGDNVKFTFKGVQTQVDFTAESIQEYILGLGEVEGVSGATAAISETLAGKVSNLGDSYDQLLNSIGDSSLWKGAVDGLSSLLSATTELVEYVKQDAVSGWEKFMNVVAIATGNPSAIANMTATNAAIEAQTRAQLEADAATSTTAESAKKASAKVVEATKQQIEAWHNLGRIAYLTGEVMKDAWGSASEVSISGPMVEMDRLVDPEMEAAMMGLGAELEVLKEKLDSYNESLAIASEAGAIFGSVLQSSFEAALINGENFFDVFIDGLKKMVMQLIAAAATATILSAILSAFMPSLGFKAAFGQVASGMGGGSGGLGGIFKLFGTDLVASTGRTTGQQGRF